MGLATALWRQPSASNAIGVRGSCTCTHVPYGSEPQKNGMGIGHACLVSPYPLTRFQRPSYNLIMKGYPACACTLYHTCTARGQDFKLREGVYTYPPTRFGVDRYKHLTCSAEFGTQLVSWCLLRCIFATPLSPGTSFVAFLQHEILAIFSKFRTDIQKCLSYSSITSEGLSRIPFSSLFSKVNI